MSVRESVSSTLPQPQVQPQVVTSIRGGQRLVPVLEEGLQLDKKASGTRTARSITRADLFKNRLNHNERDLSSQSLYRRSKRQRVNATYGLRLLRTKLLGPDSDGASCEDVLTMLLCNALEASSARKMAGHLLQTFGTLRAIFGAEETLLIRHCGGNEECVDLVFGYHMLMKTALREPFESQPVLADMAALIDYLLLTTVDPGRETFRILFLNPANMLIKDEVISRGTVDHVPVYVREVLKRTLEVGATAVILVHNHPTGSSVASSDDLAMTNRLQRSLNDINVILHDHIIVGRHTCQSMRNAGMIAVSQVAAVSKPPPRSPGGAKQFQSATQAL